MVDKEKFYDTIEARKKLDNNYPWLEEEVWNPRLEALGEDEDDIIEFMDNADEEVLAALWSVYDELMDKFPSKKMDRAIDRYLENYQKAFNVRFK
ncbi:hypothetical protein OCV67_13195 [Porcipelethomonas ammoniilytica]|uniref:hypothetical protein n=1 Tax=Porcipelethomonas ammoniilytica TaxID=2981722 RepID=UPI0008211589|nr:hypothetical protein [Porcipelethomonas ammoniilytica]MCU6720876.1 hypothetical protein [Porcipelethomonas ammoniilytica]SCJ28790.1 Uncharacterised protein [uncultured Ruminococcus sp.]